MGGKVLAFIQILYRFHCIVLSGLAVVLEVDQGTAEVVLEAIQDPAAVPETIHDLVLHPRKEAVVVPAAARRIQDLGLGLVAVPPLKRTEIQERKIR